MLDELKNITGSEDFEEYGTVYLQGVTSDVSEPGTYGWDDSKAALQVLKLSLNVNTRANTESDQIWEVECVGVRDHRMYLGYCEGFYLYDDHVLLWPYTYPHVCVSFYGEAKDPLAVVRALMKTHFDLTWRWVPFDQYTNGQPLEMIVGRYGLFAEGPMPLMEAYAKVLERFGIGASITNSHFGSSRIYDESTGAPKPEVLILDDYRKCYVVASKFNAHRVA